MASLAEEALQQCPSTKIVLSGYSQGAMVVHYAVRKVDNSKIAAIAVFGDPLNGESFGTVAKTKLVNYCGKSDFICDHGPTNVSGSHISYFADASEAAQAIVTAGGLKASARV